MQATLVQLKRMLLAGSVLHLLTVVFGSGQTASAGSLEQLIPRLWPLFRHPLTKVRLATVQCMQAFLAHSHQAQTWLNASLMEAALRSVPMYCLHVTTICTWIVTTVVGLSTVTQSPPDYLFCNQQVTV